MKTYNNIIKENQSVICIKCQIDNIPFQNLTEIEFIAVNKGIETDIEALHEVSVTSSSLKTFFNEINKSNPFSHTETDHDEIEDALLINCKYVDLSSFNYKPNPKHFSLFHTNIGSLAKHKDELQTVLTMLDYKFDVIGISETKLFKNIKPTFNINLEGYKCFHVNTEAVKGGSLLYISDTLDPKQRPDLESLLYKSEVLESTFVEIINPHKKNILLGCIYRHPSMELDEFNTYYLIPFMEILNKENKTKFLLGDFNVDLLKLDADANSSTFFDTLTSKLFVPHIVYPTRITPTSKTLIDNIFSNCTNYDDGISGNLTVSLSDHLAQFLIIPEECHHTPKKKNLYTYDLKIFDKNVFTKEFQDIHWPHVIDLSDKDPNNAFERLYAITDRIVNKHLPKRKMTKNEIKQKQKPWITKEILKSMHHRNKLYKHYLKVKD